MQNDDSSFVDRMNTPSDPLAPIHTDQPDGSEGRPAAEPSGGSAPASSPAAALSTPDPDIAALKASVEQLKDENFKTQQQVAYYRGQAERGSAPAKPEPPKPFEFKREEWKARMEAEGADPIEVFHDLANQIAEDKIRRSTGELETKVDGRLSEAQRTEQLKGAYLKDSQRTLADFGDFVSTDKNGKPINSEFDREAYDETQAMAQARGNPRLQDGSFLLSPGDLYAAASVVYGRWARQGKLPEKRVESTTVVPGSRSLRQIIEQVGHSDNLGNGRRGAGVTTAAPKSIEDLVSIGHFTQREGQAAKNLVAEMKWNEANYVSNILSAERSGETDYRM